MAVKELDTIANGRRPVGARKRCIERLKVELKDEMVSSPTHEKTKSKLVRDTTIVCVSSWEPGTKTQAKNFRGKEITYCSLTSCSLK